LEKKFSKDSKLIIDFLTNLNETDKNLFQKELDESKSKKFILNEKEFEITNEMCRFIKKEKKVSGYSYVPAVIEPAFGIGRIIYSLLEHSYWVRPEDEKEKKKIRINKLKDLFYLFHR